MLAEPKQHGGFTLVETLIAIGIFSILSLAIYLSIILAINILRDDQNRLDALAIAQSQLEEIKNVSYDDVGTVSGVPAGTFMQNTTVVQNDTLFTVDIDIRYIDDTFDDIAPTDLVNTDYKKVSVIVSWENQFLNEPVELVTTIVPPGLENDEGGGTLWVEVFDTASDPVVNAQVHITNTQTLPTIDVTGYTDQDGKFLLPGAPADTQSYHIEVTKNGYSSAQTYPEDPENNPNPDPEDLTVIAGEITTKSFILDLVSSIDLVVQDNETGTPLADIPVRVFGDKRIGTNLEGEDIPKFDQTLQTDGDGQLTLSNIEYDSYTIKIDDPLLDFAGSTPHIPLVLAPNTAQSMTLVSSPDQPFTFLLTVEDINELPIVGAEVTLSNGIDPDVVINTNDSGQIFVNTLTSGTYTVSVTATGQTPYTGEVDIVGDEQQTIQLFPFSIAP